MEHLPKVSYIVPVYKTEAYLPQCVESLRRQTCPDIELILVDDGSPDGCPALCDAYAAQDERIRVVHKKNGGLVSAWMAGVAISSGQYLAFVDSDDWVDDEMTEAMLAHAGGAKKEIICCGYLLEKEKSVAKGDHSLAPGIYEKEQLEGDIRQRILGNSPRLIIMSRCMKLFSRQLIVDNLSFCDPTIVMGEDVNITLSALLDCERLVILEAARYYHYRLLAASMAHRYDPKLYDNICRLRDKLRQVFAAKGIANGEEQAEKEFLLLFLLVMRNELRGNGREGIRVLQGLLKEEVMRRLVRETPLTVRDKADACLYLGMRHPNKLLLWCLQKLLKAYDLRGC